MGFEPTVPIARYNAFRVRPVQPLLHSSLPDILTYTTFMSFEYDDFDDVLLPSDRIPTDETIVEKYLEVRQQCDLSDEDFIAMAGASIVVEHLRPVFRDALGLHGPEFRAAVLPLMPTLASLGEKITADLVRLHTGVKGA